MPERLLPLLVYKNNYGDTLCDLNNPVILEKSYFQNLLLILRLSQKKAKEKMGIALQRLAEEDPTFEFVQTRN